MTLAYSQTLAYSHLLVFGHSLCDDGNCFRATRGKRPAHEVYHEGRYSSGKMFPEYLAEHLGITSVRNFAFAGATSDNALAQGYVYDEDGPFFPSPSLLEQIDAYIDRRDLLPAKETLVIVSAGGNDVFSTRITVDQTVAAVQRGVQRLHASGLRNFLIVSDYSIAATPWPHAAKLSNAEVQAFEDYAAASPTLLQKLELPADCHWLVLNLYEYLRCILKAPHAFGFDHDATFLQQHSVLTGTYAKGECTVDRNNKLLWVDEFHGSEELHRLIAKRALEVLNGCS